MGTTATAVQYHPRGIGANWLACFLCKGIKDGYSDLKDNEDEPSGEVVSSTLDDDGIHYHGGYYSCQPDMAAVVNGKDSGIKIVKMFQAEGCTAFLDYRPNQPKHVQVKVGACDNHLPNLEELLRLTSQHRVISREIIKQAKAYKPE